MISANVLPLSIQYKKTTFSSMALTKKDIFLTQLEIKFLH